MVARIVATEAFYDSGSKDMRRLVCLSIYHHDTSLHDTYIPNGIVLPSLSCKRGSRTRERFDTSRLKMVKGKKMKRKTGNSNMGKED